MLLPTTIIHLDGWRSSAILSGLLLRINLLCSQNHQGSPLWNCKAISFGREQNIGDRRERERSNKENGWSPDTRGWPTVIICLRPNERCLRPNEPSVAPDDELNRGDTLGEARVEIPGSVARSDWGLITIEWIWTIKMLTEWWKEGDRWRVEIGTSWI